MSRPSTTFCSLCPLCSPLDVPSSYDYIVFFFFFNDTATTEIYTLSLHDALPISGGCGLPVKRWWKRAPAAEAKKRFTGDRKSTRLNSSHGYISYAVFCLKKKKTKNRTEKESTYDRQANVRSYRG